jgi:hypothetical protein
MTSTERTTPTHTAAMVFLKIAIVVAGIAGVLVMAQRGDWFERAGLLARCTQVSPPYGNATRTGEWWSCTEGSISGYKSLVRDGCDSKGFYSKTQLWYCPSAIGSPS